MLRANSGFRVEPIDLAARCLDGGLEVLGNQLYAGADDQVQWYADLPTST